jgi:hypothetical protein
MKKLKKILLALIGLLPLILNADTIKEVNNNEIIIEENVHYEKDVENICEYYETIDKNKYMYGDWVYTLKKPEIKEDREIQEEIKKISFDRNINNVLKIDEFEGELTTIKIYELEILDKNNNSVKYTTTLGSEENKIFDQNNDTFIELGKYYNVHIFFENPQYIDELTINLKYQSDKELLGIKFSSGLTEEIITNVFSKLVTNIDNNCNNNICTMKITAVKDVMIKEEISFNVITYKYRDKYYKCYRTKKININDYIKKENQTLNKENLNSNNLFTNKSQNSEVKIKEEKTPVNISSDKQEKIKTSEIETSIKDKLAFITETKPKDKKNNNYKTFLAVSLLGILILSIIFTKKVIKSRTK